MGWGRGIKLKLPWGGEYLLAKQLSLQQVTQLLWQMFASYCVKCKLYSYLLSREAQTEDYQVSSQLRFQDS